MAHYVAKVLKLRPNDILDGWGVAELLVAYGQYVNEKFYDNYLWWKDSPPESKKGKKAPEPCYVTFYSPADLKE